VEAREASNVIKSMSLRSNPTPRTQNPTASSLVARSQVPKCVYCDGDHYPSACTTIQSVKDRRTFLLRAGCCFNCLRPQHHAKDCESSKKCRLCRRKHHQSICERATVVASTAVGPGEAADVTLSITFGQLNIITINL